MLNFDEKEKGFKEAKEQRKFLTALHYRYVAFLLVVSLQLILQENLGILLILNILLEIPL